MTSFRMAPFSVGYGPVKNTRNSSTSRILSAIHTMAKSPIATASVEPSRALGQDSFSDQFKGKSSWPPPSSLIVALDNTKDSWRGKSTLHLHVSG
ncbi:hypothetical protein E2C01_023687 [Portunus trituberculatus]|uniref:Uncharacterized protein n=1 Tax=Portunus trituberculatus TaxID=210409 RepID=A0A5B7EC99_PORTR|nr:hypothetical protein [Portunus trituberculatus]